MNDSNPCCCGGNENETDIVEKEEQISNRGLKFVIKDYLRKPEKKGCC